MIDRVSAVLPVPVGRRVGVLLLAAIAGVGCLTDRAHGQLDLGKLPLPTMGGKQFWADEFFFHQWRIQRNALNGECRLLDAHNFRHASGTFAECRAELRQIAQREKLPPMKGKAVIVLHGLFRSRSSMSGLGKFLEEKGGYTVFNVGYPSTRRDVGGHARSLARIIENLDGIEEINFVAHSMGNIVVRHYLADRQRRQSLARAARAKTGDDRAEKTTPRINRFVMLAPPNHGSLIALTLAENKLLKAVTGDTVRQVGAGWAELQGRLGTPNIEFAIIAGGKGDGEGFNPLLPGDDDLTVTVASTRLAGARDFLRLPVTHMNLMNDPRVQQCALRFLQHGHFVSAARRQPIAKSGEQPAERPDR